MTFPVGDSELAENNTGTLIYSGAIDVEYTSGRVTNGRINFTDGTTHTLTDFAFQGDYSLYYVATVGSPSNPRDVLQFSRLGEQPSETPRFSFTDGSTGKEYDTGTGNNTIRSTAVCFTSGTLVRTARGEVPVEALAIGDLAVTASGDLHPIRWVGHRTVERPGFEQRRTHRRGRVRRRPARARAVAVAR